MNALIQKVEAPFLKHDLPPVRVGDTVRILFKVSQRKESDSKEKAKAAKSNKSGKEKAGGGDKGGAKGGRSQAYEGVVIAQHGVGLNKSLTVRRIAHGIGVEKVIPLHSPVVEAVEVLKSGHPRRAKLFYLRRRVGKQALKVKPRRPKELVKEVATKTVAKAAAEEAPKEPAPKLSPKPASRPSPKPASKSANPTKAAAENTSENTSGNDSEAAPAPK